MRGLPQNALRSSLFIFWQCATSTILRMKTIDKQVYDERKEETDGIPSKVSGNKDSPCWPLV
jgi:hypothetical protein